jgi:dethiobiotin synthetase
MATSHGPARLVLVTGTGTEVGKTWVSVALLDALRRAGHTVAARKPAQSFEPGDDTRGATDAQLLAAASGEVATDVCPAHRWYPVPLAPPMAADALRRPTFSLDDLAAEIRWPPGIDVGLVETAGGVASPLAATPTGAGADDTTALARRLDPDQVVLVADAELGTINAVRLCTAALADRAPALTVHLNRYDDASDLHRRNRAWLEDRDALPVTVAIGELAARIGSIR